jgi:hypothetical protein
LLLSMISVDFTKLHACSFGSCDNIPIARCAIAIGSQQMQWITH